VERGLFLARLRAARARAGLLPEEVPPAAPARSPPSVDRFREELLKVGGRFTPVGHADVARAMAERAVALEARAFACERGALLAACGVAAELRRVGLAEIEPPADPERARAVLDRARLGIVEADVAISQSGTVGLVADAERGRLLSALARLLFVLVDPRRLVGRLEDLPGWLGARGLPSALALFTGPSRTGDIEGSLILGAHGSTELHVFWLADHS